MEALFSIGDVVRVRTQEVAVGSRRLELSMLAYKDDADEDDDYVVEGRDPEGDEDKFAAQDADDEEETVAFDAESTLIWWRGAAYHKIVGETSGPKVDEDFEVLDESIKIVEGTWRRMFEVDMREDEQDFNSKAMEAEMKELEEEIGELGGMDDDMIDCVGFGSSTHTQRVGSFVSMSSLPAEVPYTLHYVCHALYVLSYSYAPSIRMRCNHHLLPAAKHSSNMTLAPLYLTKSVERGDGIFQRSRNHRRQ